MSDRYILIGQTPVPCDDLLVWARWFEDDRYRQVAVDYAWGRLVTVSTVFLGLDHNFRNCGEPLLFETMTFWWPGEYNSHQRRCSTWIQAEAMHQEVLAEVRQPKEALAFFWWAIRKWVEQLGRDIDSWIDRQYKLPRGIPLEPWETLAWDYTKMRRRWWLQSWRARLINLWRAER